MPKYIEFLKSFHNISEQYFF